MEDEHWWYATLHHLVLEHLKTRVPVGKRLLDAGCGTGGLLAKLAAWDAHGIDASPAAISHCLERGLRHIHTGDVNKLPFESQSFDALISLDVLYHEQVDEAQALQEMHRVLKPEGLLIMNLPAFACLRGAHDRSVCGKRRYTTRQVRETLSIHSLKLEMSFYWNTWLFLPLLIWRSWSRRHASSATDLRPLPRWMNRILLHFAHIDIALSSRTQIPFGTSVFTIARKHSQP